MSCEDEVRKAVEAMFDEAHPFRTATASYHQFAKPMSALPELPDEELRHVLGRVLDLLSALWWCTACCCKAAAFGELIARPRWPDDAKVFGEFLDERVAEAEAERRGSAGDRDFREEVRLVIGLHVPDFDARS